MPIHFASVLVFLALCFGCAKLARVFMGEGAGLIYSVESAEKVTREVAREAEEQLEKLYGLRQP